MSFVPPDLTPAMPELFMLVAVCVVLLVDVLAPVADQHAHLSSSPRRTVS